MSGRKDSGEARLVHASGLPADSSNAVRTVACFSSQGNQESRNMLVLSRRGGESIRIGDVLVSIVSVAGNRVKVGIDAPQEQRILRTELESDPRQSNRGPDTP